MIDTLAAPKKVNHVQSVEKSLLNQAVRQVNYYFSDKNYAKDKYLKAVAGRNADAWVPLGEILAFNKMRVLMRGSNQDELVEALSRGEKSNSFELSTDGK